MIEFIIVVLVVLWLLGAFAVHVGGGFIYLLLIIALVLLIIRLARGDRL